jgi:hypothetical protein
MSEKQYIIDIDFVIESWNALNPDEKKMTKNSLSKMLNVSAPSINNWGKKAPDLVFHLFKLQEIANCSFDDLLKEESTVVRMNKEEYDKYKSNF